MQNHNVNNENPHKKSLYRNYCKKYFDFILALAAILLLSPLFLVIAILIRVTLGRPILFRQERPGLNGRIFTLYKFRTMTNEKNENGELLPNHVRLTNLGKFLRSTSLDELPELFNILKGDMSFIGPRPLLVEYLPLYNEKQKRRHTVKPGLSGLAQINGRNAITWGKKFNYDLEYVDKVSFLLDVKILLITVYKVLVRESVNSSESVTMEKFMGN